MRVELRFTTDELDELIAKAKAAPQRQRLRVIRWAMDGLTAPEVARQTKLCRRQVQNWVRRFNALGLAGLKDKPGRGRPCPLSVEQQVEFKARLTASPTPEDNVCTLRGEDIQRILKQEFGVLRKLSSVYYLLHSLGYSSLVPRPRHVQADSARQELFKKASCPSSSPPSAKRILKTNPSLLPRRSAVWSARHTDACVGSLRITPSGGTANAVRLFVRDRCNLSGDRPGRGDFFAVPQYRYDQRFSPRVLGCDRSGRAGCLDLGWGRLSHERTTRSAGQCKPDPTATLLPRAQSDRKPLALSAKPLLVQPQIRRLCRP